MTKKRILVWMLILVMAVTLAPAAVSADSGSVSGSAGTAIGGKLVQNILIERQRKSIRYNLLEAGSKTLEVLTVKNAMTKLSYEKTGGAKYFKVSEKTGKITIPKGTRVGEYSVKIKVSAAASAKYKAFSKTVTIRISIKPGIQPMLVVPNHQSVSYSKTKSASVTLKNVLDVEGAVGTVTYKKVSGTDYITVNEKTGAVTVKKGTPKSTGTYRIGIKVTASGNSKYLKANRSVTLHVTVK